MANALRIVQKYFPKVRKVMDAEESIAVKVSSQDNNSAKVRNHKSCAMAVACKRLRHADGVIVSVATAYVIKKGVATRYKLPPSVSREIVSFDRMAGFAPGDYQLSKPSPASKLGGSRSNNGSHAHTGKGKKIKRTHHTDGIRTVLGSK